MVTPCFRCGGAAHPATGEQYTETCISCWRCTLEFYSWVRRHTSRRWGKVYFYECAGKK